MSTLLAAWAGAVGVFDWRTRRVPNWALVVVLVPALLALLVNGRGLLGQAALPSILGMLLVALAFWPGYRGGKTGAGDVKFAACLGLLLGWRQGLEFVLLALIAIAVCALTVVAWQWRRTGAVNLRQRIPAAAAIAVAFWIELFQGPMLDVFAA